MFQHLANTKIGCLLMNIGTPSEPTISGLRSYLKEFLSDPDVIDTNPLLRWIIVNLFVVPFRPQKVLPQYQSVWMDEGSPLLVYTKNFVKKITKINPDIIFDIGMRYGKPSIEQGLRNLQEAKVEKIVLCPMFPQYAQATSGSCIKKAIQIIEDQNINTPYEINSYFYDEDFIIDCLAETIEKSDVYQESEFFIFSFHGLPERQVKKMDISKSHCLIQDNCCEIECEFNKMCYKHHCYETVKNVMNKVSIKKPFDIAFQSRFGFDPWIKPNTTDIIEALPGKGIKNISVICPAFVFDCLETLEEIAIRNQEYYVEAGGENIKLIPALNDGDKWVNEFYNYIYNKFA